MTPKSSDDRSREYSGIYFASEPAGRTAKVAGPGLAVWEVLRDYVRDQDIERVRRAFGQLSQPQITEAVMCYGRYAEEIRREVATNTALTPRALEQRYPGLVRVVPLD
jgi:uncharacterized protein (DUF433 family)